MNIIIVKQWLIQTNVINMTKNIDFNNYEDQ